MLLWSRGQVYAMTYFISIPCLHWELKLQKMILTRSYGLHLRAENVKSIVGYLNLFFCFYANKLKAIMLSICIIKIYIRR